MLFLVSYHKNITFRLLLLLLRLHRTQTYYKVDFDCYNFRNLTDFAQDTIIMTDLICYIKEIDFQ